MSTLPPTGVPDPLDSELRHLVRDPHRAEPHRLWRLLRVEDRMVAVESLLAEGEADVREWAQRNVARQRHFRRKSVDAWDDEKLAAAAAFLSPQDPQILHTLLTRHYLGHRVELLSAYLDGLGLDHEDGLVVGDVPEDLEGEEARNAASSLLEDFPPGQVLIYLLTLRNYQPLLVPEIGKWLPDLFRLRALTDRAGEAEVEPEGEEGAAVGDRTPDRTDEFTTLDRLLVRSMVDVAQGIQGALDTDEALDLVDEIIELSSTRHRSFFHLGYADVVLDRGPRDQLRAQNPSRLAWYWSGYVNGLARSERWGDIVSAYEAEAAVRRLGRTGTGPSSTAAPLVFEALCQAGRPSEGAAFLHTDALLEQPDLAFAVHQQGRQLLWEDRAPEARALMELLGSYLEARATHGLPSDDRFVLEIKRRQAHCHRQLGELPRAKELLEELLQVESDPDVRAMVLTDLGLLEGGFQSLARVRLPQDGDHVGERREALERGTELYEASVRLDTRYSGHGHYCLGVLALTRDDWKAARSHLEVALSVFEREPDRYDAGRLVALTRLYLGMAIALEMDEVRSGRAAKLIQSGVGRDAEIPPYLVARTVEALHVASPEDAAAVADFLLEVVPHTLEHLVATDVLETSDVVLDALLERASDEGRGRDDRATDYRRAFPHLLQRQALERAGTVLDELENLAREGAGQTELLEVLRDPRRVDPVWSSEDALWARVHLLRSEGEYDEAVELLRSHFYKVLNAERFDAVGVAEDVLDVLEELAAGEEVLQPLRDALAAKSPEPAPAPDREEYVPAVRVLSIGGDERQEETTRRLRQELAEEDPKLAVEFEHPGWSGHWGPTLERLQPRLSDADAVVIMRWIRTEFGKQLRKSLEVPWTFCSGGGRATIRRSVLRAAEWGRERKGREE